MASKCGWCGARTRGFTGYCQGCKSQRHHAYARIEREGLLVDEIPNGGGWWIWTARGDVLVTGRNTKRDAVRALAAGEVMA